MQLTEEQMVAANEVAAGLQESQEQKSETELTVQERMDTTIKVLRMQHKAMSQMVAINLEQLTRVMMSSHGVSQKQKLQANAALIEAVQFALDFGLGVTKAKIRDGGEAFASQTNNLAAVLVKALDNRMVLLADNMAKQEKADQEVVLNPEELLADVELETNNEELVSE